MQTAWWYSSRVITVLVIEEHGIIKRTAPVTGKFIGQPIINLERWMTKQGKFRKEILTNHKEYEMAPKPPAKSSAPAEKSVFAAMRANGALAKNIAKAKKVQAVREFDGPDGDYQAVLNRVNHYTKDGSLGIIFEFRCIDKGDAHDQKMVIFYIFKDNGYRTVQEIQAEFFEALQLMGLETDIDDAELEKGLNGLIASKAEITLRVKTSKKGSKFINIVGLASAAKEVEATEYVEETTEEVVEEAVDEWDEVPDDDAEAIEDDEEVIDEEPDPALPSSWVGFAMIYKGTEVEVLEADDKTMKCVIKHGAKKLKVSFSALTPPEE